MTDHESADAARTAGSRGIPHHVPQSGTPHVLRAAGYEAAVASVGASLRSLTFEGRDLIVPFGVDEVRPSYRGATLAPWPNRIVDGRYSFAGTDYQVPLTEPARSHALHGLASWLDFEAIDKGPSHVVLSATIEPQTGYPWRIVVETGFALTADGLTQTVRARNVSTAPAPWGTGPHPSLVAGDGRVDDWTLELPATEVLAVTPDRLAPIAVQAVDSADPVRFDFREPRTVGAVEIDHAYTGLNRSDGVATVRLTAADGRGVCMSWDTACAWVQIHTSDKGGAPGHRAGLAVEPMTCAPDAYNRDEYDFDTGLIVLEPDTTADASWRIAAIR